MGAPNPTLPPVAWTPPLVTFLGDANQSPARYLVKAIATAWLPATALSFSIAAIYPGPSQNLKMLFGSPLTAIALVMGFGPIVETVLMRIIFWLLERLIGGRTAVCLVSALIWGMLHVASPSWGLALVWVFYVFGVCYLTWRERSRDHALVMTALVHSGVNGLSYVLYLIGPHIGLAAENRP